MGFQWGSLWLGETGALGAVVGEKSGLAGLWDGHPSSRKAGGWTALSSTASVGCCLVTQHDERLAGGDRGLMAADEL